LYIIDVPRNVLSKVLKYVNEVTLVTETSFIGAVDDPNFVTRQASKYQCCKTFLSSNTKIECLALASF
jgi:hypothetical protein